MLKIKCIDNGEQHSGLEQKSLTLNKYIAIGHLSLWVKIKINVNVFGKFSCIFCMLNMNCR